MNKIMIIQSIFGLFPCKVGKDDGKVKFSFYIWIYSFLLHAGISLTNLYLIKFVLFGDGAIKTFQDTRAACIMLQTLNLKIVYIASAVVVHCDRQKYARFFNKLNNVDRRVQILRRQANQSEIKTLIYIHIGLFVSYFVIYFILKLNFSSTAEIASSIIFGIEITTITFISYFIRAIASVLNNGMEAVISALGEVSINNSNDNVKTISECIQTFGELFYCKEQLSKIFGYQLFLSFWFDFMSISLFLYLLTWSLSIMISVTQFSTIIWQVLITLLVYAIPHITKEIVLVHEMNKFGQKV